MSRIFLSHSGKDNAAAIALRDWLKVEGWDEVFLDLDPTRGIAAGERWERALHIAATRCEAVLFLISQNWLASEWCDNEYALAKGLNKKLFALLIDRNLGIKDLPARFTGTWQVVDLSHGQDLRLFRVPLPSSHEELHIGFAEQGLVRLRRGLEKAGLDPKFFPWPPEGEPGRAPYHGLKALDVIDAGILFGRDAAIVEAMDRLRGLRSAAAPRLLAILGASGAGKSSFLRAGLWSRLKRDDANFLPLPVIRPERAAINGENGLIAALAAVFPGRTRPELRAVVEEGRLGSMLGELAQEAFRRTLADTASSKPPAILLAIDQAEELFRSDGATEGDALLKLVREVTLAEAPAVIALFAIRSDSYEALERAKALEGLRQHALPLTPLPRASYKEVIEGPARRIVETGGRLRVEPQLTERLMSDLDLGGVDALPLLAFTLEQLYLEYSAAGALRLADYEAFGGVKGAIDAAVARAMLRADVDRRIPQDRAAREALLRRGLIPWLAGIDPDTKSARRNIARRADIPAEAWPLIEHLVEERLLSTDVEESDGARIVTIEPAHEALLRQWGLLEGWLTEDFAHLAALEGVKRAARDWNQNARAPAWLAHQGQRLAEAQRLDSRPDIAARLDPVDRAYLAGCHAEEERRRAETEARRAAERRVVQRTRLGLAAALLLALLATGGGFVAWQQKLRADDRTIAAEMSKQEAVAEKNAADRASAEVKTQRDRAAAALAEAKQQLLRARVSDSILRAKGAGIESQAGRYRHALAELLPALPLDFDQAQHPATIEALTQLQTIAARDRLEFVFVEEKRDNFRSNNDRLDVAVNPSGDRMAISSRFEGVRLFQVSTGAEILRLAPSSEVNDVSTPPEMVRFDERQDRFLVADRSGNIRVYRGTALEEDLAGFGDVVDVQFTPDADGVITIGGDCFVHIWNLKTLSQTTPIGDGARTKNGTCLAGGPVFSPKTYRVAVPTAGGLVGIWDLRSREQIGAVTLEPDDKVVQLSPKGDRLIAASPSGEARLHDVGRGEIVARWITDYNGFVGAFSADEAFVVVGKKEGSIELLNMDSASQTSGDRFGKVNSVLPKLNPYSLGPAIAIDPSGRWIALLESDGAISVWDLAGGREVFSIVADLDSLTSIRYDSSGTKLVAVGREAVEIWNAEAPDEAPVLEMANADNFFLNNWALSKAGDRLAVVGAYGDGGSPGAALFETSSGREVAVLDGSGGFTAPRVRFDLLGHLAVTTGNGNDRDLARVYDAANGNALATLKHDRIFKAAFSPAGDRIVTGSGDGTAKIWDMASFRETASFKAHSATVNFAAFDATGKKLITASEDGTAKIWDAGTVRELQTLIASGGQFDCGVISPDGKYAVTGADDGAVRVWDIESGKQVAELKGHSGWVGSVEFDASGERILSWSTDGTARLWDARRGSSTSSFFPRNTGRC